MTMATLTIDLPKDLYERLRAEAERAGKPPADIARDWLAERLPPTTAASERERAREALRAAGLLVEFSPEEIAEAEAVTVTLEEVSAALDRAGGRPLSEIVLEQRGPKV
jgi:predicted transcriptional regulator